MAFWRSGEYTMTDTLAEFGLNVPMHPWLFVHGSRRTLGGKAVRPGKDAGKTQVADCGPKLSADREGTAEGRSSFQRRRNRQYQFHSQTRAG